MVSYYSIKSIVLIDFTLRKMQLQFLPRSAFESALTARCSIIYVFMRIHVELARAERCISLQLSGEFRGLFCVHSRGACSARFFRAIFRPYLRLRF